MMIKLGSQELELGGRYLDADLRDSSNLLGDGEALRQRMMAEGYLLIRGLYDRQTVLTGGRAILEFMASENAIKPGTSLEDAYVNETAKTPHLMGRKAITREPRVAAVLEGRPIMEFMSRLVDKEVLTFDYKWMRAVRKPEYTGAHYDVVYMGRGSIGKLFTAWTPFSDIPLELGPLAVCVGSHSLPGFQKLRDTYGRMDVDRDRVSGWYSDDPVDVVDRMGGKWKTTSFRAGDVLIFTMFTLHMSLANATDRWRISTDTRFQPADEPVDERWIGENPKAHYAWFSEPDKMVPMATMREKWGV